jgi:hypothetical protein
MDPIETENKTPESEVHTNVKSLRTFQGDVDEVLSKGKTTPATILVAEQNRNRERPDLAPPPSEQSTESRNKLFITLGFVLLFIGAVTLSGVYYFKSKEQVVIIQKTKALIAFNEEKDIPMLNLTRDDLITKIIYEKSGFKLKSGSILYINVVDELNNSVKASNIFPILTTNMSGPLLRSFDDKYMIGVYYDNLKDMFIVIKISDYASAFAGMLKWEKDAPSDIGKVFGFSQIINEQQNKNFEDEAFRNKDLRVLKDTNNTTQFLYSFIDKETLVMTTNENTLTEIINKFAIANQVK